MCVIIPGTRSIFTRNCVTVKLCRHVLRAQQQLDRLVDRQVQLGRGDEHVVAALRIIRVDAERVVGETSEASLCPSSPVRAGEAVGPVPLLADGLDDRRVRRNVDELAPDEEPGREHRGDADGGARSSATTRASCSRGRRRPSACRGGRYFHTTQARKRFTAMKTMPVTQNVSTTVSSMVDQFDAIGVNHHGLAKWNMREPMTRRTSTTAIAIGKPPC
jgi:hypothetical protein